MERGNFFVIHAPRQTGKTTLLASLARSLLAEGEYVALRFSCETGEVAGDDYGAAENLVLGAIQQAALGAKLPAGLAPPAPWPEAVPGSRLRAGLGAWAQRCPKPLVLFFDEIDALRGESLPQLVLMGFLHRIVNGGGYVTREYGTGWKRVDICVRWPYQDAGGKRGAQREAIELKVWRRGRDPLADGLKQLDEYLDRLGLDTGTLVVFDRRKGEPPPYEQTRFDTDRTPSGRTVTLLRA